MTVQAISPPVLAAAMGYGRLLATGGSIGRSASKFWTPPMPMRFIHAKSLAMPSLLTLPFIQCHHTLGRPLTGGSRNGSASATGAACVAVACAAA